MSDNGSGEREYLKSGRLGRWRLLENINTGSFGHVVLCADEKDPSAKVAIKVQDREEARYHQGKEQNANGSVPEARTPSPPSRLRSTFTPTLPNTLSCTHTLSADFKIEIDILNTICSRPERPASIVHMVEYFKHEGRWCIAFELLGPSL